MSNFVIFEDQENFKQKSTPTLAEGKRDRPKLVPLPNKENAIKNQVRNLFAASRLCLLKFFFFHQVSKSVKPSGTSAVVSGAFKLKNVYVSKDENSGKEKTTVEESETSIINVISEDWPADGLESSSFRYFTSYRILDENLINFL